MKTLTITVQQLESKEDLDLLIQEDVVNVEFETFSGRAVFSHDDEGTLHFLRRNGEKIINYGIEIWDIDVRDNRIIQKPNKKLNVETCIEYQMGYGPYNQILSRAGL